MSLRRKPINVEQILTSYGDRIRALEERSSSGRFNRLRIGNLTVEATPSSSSSTPTHLKITNLSTGAVTMIATP